MTWFEDLTDAEVFGYFTAIAMLFCLIYPSYTVNKWIVGLNLVYFPVLATQTWLAGFVHENWSVEALSQDASTRISYVVGIPLGIVFWCCVKFPLYRLLLVTVFAFSIIFAASWLPPWGWWAIPFVTIALIVTYVVCMCRRKARGQSPGPSAHKMVYDLIVSTAFHTCVSYVCVAAIRWINTDHSHPLLGTSWTQDWYLIWAGMMVFRLLETALLVYIVRRRQGYETVFEMALHELDDVGTGDVFDNDDTNGLSYRIASSSVPSSKSEHFRNTRLKKQQQEEQAVSVEEQANSAFRIMGDDHEDQAVARMADAREAMLDADNDEVDDTVTVDPTPEDTASRSEAELSTPAEPQMKRDEARTPVELETETAVPLDPLALL